MTAEQLKASILQMAIADKLVPQLDDEPAVDIEAVELEEEPFAIPEKWKWITVQDAMESISTGPFGSMLHKTDYVADGIPVINPANLATGNIVPSQSMMVSAETVARLSSYCLHTGMVVMGRRGEMGRCAEVTEKEDGWLCGTGSFFMKPNSDLVAKFVCLFFSTGYARNYLMGESVGTTMSNLNHKILKRLPMPIPPKKEQARILARLNEILPPIEEYGKAYSALKNAEEALPDQLRASLLQEAIQGKLVPQLDDEPAVDIEAVEPEEVPFAIPEKWKWASLESLFIFVDYRGKTPTKASAGVRLMTASNVRKGYIDHTRVEFISEEEFASRQSRGLSCKGDILFTTEAPLGNAALADLEVYSAGQRVITLQSDFVDKQLYVYFIISPYFQKLLAENATGTTAQGIKAAKLKKLLLPVPPPL